MKSIYKTLIGIAFFILLPYISIACEITVNVDGVNKQKYKAGDVVILKINVKKSHRNCSVDNKETKIRQMFGIGAHLLVSVNNQLLTLSLKILFCCF